MQEEGCLLVWPDSGCSSLQLSQHHDVTFRVAGSRKANSCNRAVFYHGATNENMNFLHMSCPALESCILKARINVVLYNIMTDETKGYSGRNYTSDNEAPAWEAAALGVCLIPVVLCSYLIFLCFCTVAPAAGYCRSRKGHYQPVRRGRTISRQIKYTTVQGSL
ncbi:MANSC domain-containing protein 4 [Numida meleagris]|uniref:MANSC domain-containing protein 4 n=1 Tax=Numida meleagris TaxID=8996 RepID=UPI000B3DE138|nr:MANSC domain-containing protein 4 [Numida meleagris]